MGQNHRWACAGFGLPDRVRLEGFDYKNNQPMKTSAVRIIQRDLQARGYDPGPVDGRLGPRTYRALQ